MSATKKQVALVCLAYVKDCDRCGGVGFYHKWRTREIREGPRRGQKRTDGKLQHQWFPCGSCHRQRSIALALLGIRGRGPRTVEVAIARLLEDG